MNSRFALVDDDQNILASVSIALENEGYVVKTFFDSEQALIEIIGFGKIDIGFIVESSLQFDPFTAIKVIGKFPELL